MKLKNFKLSTLFSPNTGPEIYFCIKFSKGDFICSFEFGGNYNVICISYDHILTNFTIIEDDKIDKVNKNLFSTAEKIIKRFFQCDELTFMEMLSGRDDLKFKNFINNCLEDED